MGVDACPEPKGPEPRRPEPKGPEPKGRFSTRAVMQGQGIGDVRRSTNRNDARNLFDLLMAPAPPQLSRPSATSTISSSAEDESAMRISQTSMATSKHSMAAQSIPDSPCERPQYIRAATNNSLGTAAVSLGAAVHGHRFATYGRRLGLRS